jgi:hypothetical protein
MKCGLASYADLALGTANLEHPEGGQITRLRPLRRPSQPKQHRDFHQAETELTTPRAWRYCWGQKKRWFKFPIHPSQYQWYEPQSQLALPGVGRDHHYAWFDNYFVDRLAIAAKWLDTHALSQKPEDHYCAVSRDDRTMAIPWGLYLGDVQEGDRKHGHLQEMLDGARATRPLVTIVTSDHGEHFGEHRLFQHVAELAPGSGNLPPLGYVTVDELKTGGPDAPDAP